MRGKSCIERKVVDSHSWAGLMSYDSGTNLLACYYFNLGVVSRKFLV
jgi:hypothetical protein